MVHKGGGKSGGVKRIGEGSPYSPISRIIIQNQRAHVCVQLFMVILVVISLVDCRLNS